MNSQEPTKFEAATELFNEMVSREGVTRSDIIESFHKELGIAFSTAFSYYDKIVKVFKANGGVVLNSKNSMRQQVFNRLDELTHLARKDAVTLIEQEFNITTSYVKTLFQQYRKSKIEAGDMVETFTVKEKDGDLVVSSHYKFESDVTDDDAVTVEEAFRVYRKGVEDHLALVDAKLEGLHPVLMEDAA